MSEETKLQRGPNGLQCPNCSKPDNPVWLDEDTGDRYRLVCFCCDAMFPTPTEYADREFNHAERKRFYEALGRPMHHYGTADLEETFETVSDLVDRLLRTSDGLDVDPATLPQPLTVLVMAPMKAELLGPSVLETCLENLDADYGHPNGDPCTPTETMLEAANRFVAVLASEYVSYWYESTGDEFEFDLKGYLAEREVNPAEADEGDFITW